MDKRKRKDRTDGERGMEKVRGFCPQRRSWKQAGDKPTSSASKTLYVTPEELFQVRRLDWSISTYQTIKRKKKMISDTFQNVLRDQRFKTNTGGCAIYFRSWYLFNMTCRHSGSKSWLIVNEHQGFPHIITSANSVIKSVCPSKISQKLINGFWWSFLEG